MVPLPNKTNPSMTHSNSHSGTWNPISTRNRSKNISTSMSMDKGKSTRKEASMRNIRLNITGMEANW